MNLKKASTFLLGLGLAAALSVPAWADTVNARLKSVDAAANTITVTERKQDTTLTVNGDTHFLNVAGGELANGIKSGDLKPGARLAITFTKTGDTSLASEIKLRAARPKPAEAAPATPAVPATPVTP